MKKTPGRTAAAERVLPKHDPDGTPAGVVCMALTLAIVVLAIRMTGTMW